MSIYYVLRPYLTPSGFNVVAEGKQEAIAIANKTFGYCENTTAREIDKDISGVLVSKETTIPYEPNPLPNFKRN